MNQKYTKEINVVIILIATLLTISSCESEFVEPYESFIIPEGTHQGNFPIQLLEGNNLSFTAIFDESAIYETIDPVNQYDINKLMGFAECNDHHHTNSARFGWRYLEGNLEIHSYVYNHGTWTNQFLGNVSLNEPHHFSIQLLNRQYSFTLDNNPSVILERTNKCERGAYYMLFPYFGGDEVAPHNITIKIKQDF